MKNLNGYIPMSEEILTDLYQLASNKEGNIRTLPQPANTIPLFKQFPELEKTIPYISLGDLPTPITPCDNLAGELGVHCIYMKLDGLSGQLIKHPSTSSGRAEREVSEAFSSESIEESGRAVGLKFINQDYNSFERDLDKNSNKDVSPLILSFSKDARLFGGNKVRKLEFLLADALQHNARTVMTFGCAGSNHSLATAVYAQQVGLKCILMLKPQCNSHVLRRNLLLDHYVGAQLISSPTNQLRGVSTVYKTMMHKQKYGDFPYIIPTGGSNPLGILGFVNAAFELRQQIEEGLMPEPDRIYVPLGSAGTTVGLLVGIKAAGLKSKIIGVAVEPEEEPNQFKDAINDLFYKTKALLRDADPSFPNISYTDDDLKILLDFAGKDYALFTKEGVAAIDLVKNTENITLDGVYTGKAMSGMIHDVKENAQKDDVILFWNTFCSSDFKEIIDSVDYKALPVYLHDYFECDVQELDR